VPSSGEREIVRDGSVDGPGIPEAGSCCEQYAFAVLLPESGRAFIFAYLNGSCAPKTKKPFALTKLHALHDKPICDALFQFFCAKSSPGAMFIKHPPWPVCVITAATSIKPWKIIGFLSPYVEEMAVRWAEQGGVIKQQEFLTMLQNPCCMGVLGM